MKAWTQKRDRFSSKKGFAILFSNLGPQNQPSGLTKYMLLKGSNLSPEGKTITNNNIAINCQKEKADLYLATTSAACSLLTS